MQRLVTVTTVRFDYEAQLFKSCLGAAGIPCLLAGEYVASHIGRADWGHPLGGIRVQVREQDLASAQEVLRLDEKTDVRPVRGPWHSVITGGLLSVPLPLRILLVVLGGPFFLSWVFVAFALAWTSLGDVAPHLKP